MDNQVSGAKSTMATSKSTTKRTSIIDLEMLLDEEDSDDDSDEVCKAIRQILM